MAFGTAPSPSSGYLGLALERERHVLAVVAFVLVAMLARDLADQVANAVTVYGSARAPLSDALDPWLLGALHYLFLDGPQLDLYRPTIGIFFGSIVAVAGRADAIPAVFATLLVAALLACIMKADRDLRPALVAWLAYVVIEFGIALKPLNFGNIMPDAPAFLFTIFGASWLLAAIRARPVDGRALAAAFLSLGLAATIRGPMMLAGPAMLVAVAALVRDRREARAVALAAVLFLLPLAIDVQQQRTHGVLNNGLATLFCIYTDPSHSWTMPCHDIYVAARPAAATVLANYLHMLVDGGYSVVLGNLGSRLYAEGVRMHTAGFRVAAVALVVYLGVHAVATVAAGGRLRSRLDLVRAAVTARHGFLPRLALLAAVGSYAFALPPETFTAYVSAGIAAVCVLFGLPRAAICLAAYWLGAVFLALLTQAHQDRLGLTFSFLLYLALFLAVSEQRRPTGPASPPTKRSAVAPVYAVIGVLYLAVFLYPSPLARSFKAAAARQDAAVVSRDEAHGRCLYFNWRADMFYRPCRPEDKLR